MIDLNKIEETCSNVYLIDENLCLSNSYQILNSNFQTLSNALVELDSYGNYFNNIFTIFSSNSARWNKSISNWESLSAKWLDSETTVKSLSSSWQKPVTIIYSRILDLVAYFLNESSQKNIIRNWLNSNIRQYIAEQQEVHVDLYLSHSFAFTWRYFKKYYENCIPLNTGIKGSCPVPSLPRWGCNRVVAAGVGYGGCNNATAFCNTPRTIQNTTLQGINSLKCSNGGAKNVFINYNRSSTDKSLCRVVKIKYRKVNNSFILI
jgi:hypothetical protein